MPNFESPTKHTPSQDVPDRDFIDEEIERLEDGDASASAGSPENPNEDREKYFVQALEAVVDDEAKAYVTSIMDAIRSLPGDTMPSIEQMVEGLTNDAVERLKKSDKSLVGITPDSKGVRALVRRGLRKALEGEMRNLGSDDLEILGKVEKLLDRIS